MKNKDKYYINLEPDTLKKLKNDFSEIVDRINKFYGTTSPALIYDIYRQKQLFSGEPVNKKEFLKFLDKYLESIGGENENREK